MTRRILVTGAGGLIGRQVIAPLQARGFHVVATTRGREIAGADQTITCDLLDSESRAAAIRTAQCTDLMHLAWHDAPQGRWQAAENVDWAAASLSLVREFARAGGKRVVATGSCAEYDWSYESLSEETPLKPGTLYGHAKATTGVFLTSAAADLGLSLAWARIFFCYGPGEPRGRLLGDLIYGLATGERIATTDGLQERDFMHTADIGRALAMVAESALEGVVNISSGQAIKVRDLVMTAARLAGREDLIDLGARPRPEFDPPRLVGPNTRLASLGFVPEIDLAVGLKECLRKSIDLG